MDVGPYVGTSIRAGHAAGLACSSSWGPRSFCFLSPQGIKVSSAIFASATRFGWPSAFAVCRCSRRVPLLHLSRRLGSPESFKIFEGAGRRTLKALKYSTCAPRPLGTPWPKPARSLGLLENPLARHRGYWKNQLALSWSVAGRPWLGPTE